MGRCPKPRRSQPRGVKPRQSGYAAIRIQTGARAAPDTTAHRPPLRTVRAPPTVTLRNAPGWAERHLHRRAAPGAQEVKTWSSKRDWRLAEVSRRHPDVTIRHNSHFFSPQNCPRVPICVRAGASKVPQLRQAQRRRQADKKRCNKGLDQTLHTPRKSLPKPSAESHFRDRPPKDTFDTQPPRPGRPGYCNPPPPDGDGSNAAWTTSHDAPRVSERHLPRRARQAIRKSKTVINTDDRRRQRRH